MNNKFDFLNTFPDFLYSQKSNFCWFLEYVLLEEIFSITGNYNINNKLLLRLASEDLKISCQTSMTKGAFIYNLLDISFPAHLLIKSNLNLQQLKKKIRLHIHIPLMTTKGTFLINGCERVVISQIIKSPGIYFEKNKKYNFKNQKSINLIDKKTFIKIKKSIILKQKNKEKTYKNLIKISFFKNYKNIFFYKTLINQKIFNNFFQFFQFFSLNRLDP